MNLLREPPDRASQNPLARGSPRSSWPLGVVLLLAGYLLFAHGCHGDEDNEPFALLRHLAGAAAMPADSAAD